MRRVLVDHARIRAARKRPAEALRVSLDDDIPGVDPRGCDLLALDHALSELAQLDPRQGRIVELAYFGGLSETEVAGVIAVSRSTVARELRSAKAWLYRRMTTGPQPERV
jgi:RNA polymerase sigma factor (TIGR02999 family)